MPTHHSADAISPLSTPPRQVDSATELFITQQIAKAGSQYEGSIRLIVADTVRESDATDQSALCADVRAAVVEQVMNILSRRERMNHDNWRIAEGQVGRGRKKRIQKGVNEGSDEDPPVKKRFRY